MLACSLQCGFQFEAWKSPSSENMTLSDIMYHVLRMAKRVCTLKRDNPRTFGIMYNEFFWNLTCMPSWSCWMQKYGGKSSVCKEPTKALLKPRQMLIHSFIYARSEWMTDRLFELRRGGGGLEYGPRTYHLQNT